MASSSSIDPHEPMRGRDVQRVRKGGEQAPRPAHEMGEKSEAPPKPENGTFRVEDVKTAPADLRFPSTNQTRHCYVRFIEYHKCVGAKGKGTPECEKFARYYRSLCPSDWIAKWNEELELGIFPGPL